MRRFENKVALVTGGANGIGEAIVRRLVQEGAKVVIADIEGNTAKNLSDTLPESTYPVTVDVRNKAQVEAMVKAAIEKYGRIDLLFNNAGIMVYETFLEFSEETWDLIHDTNLKGCFLVGQAVAKAMVDKGIEGVIVNTASIASDIVAAPTTAGYASSKGGVLQLTKAMALDLAPYNIRVNCVGPGTTITRLTEKTRSNPERVADFLSKFTIKRFAEPSEIASVALFLASDDASYVSGTIYYADAGWRIG